MVSRIRGNTYTCIECNGEYRRAATVAGKFCSQKCATINKRNLYIADWLVGNNNGSQASGEMSAWVRNYLLEQAGYKCIECGWGKPNPVIGKVILTIEHIDGNWRNNAVDNVKVLCYNCHTLTETFGSLNKGNFPANKRNVGSRRH